MKVDGVPYVFELSEVSSALEFELFRQTGSGLTLTQIFEAMESGPGSFHLAALVFLARRSRGDEITFDEIAGAMGFGSAIEVEVDDGAESEPGDGDRPEVTAAG